MNTTKNQHDVTGSGRPQHRIRRLACVALAVMTSAGLGAAAQNASASTRTKPNVSCPATRPDTGIVLIAFPVSTAGCAEVPVLVSSRGSARASL